MSKPASGLSNKLKSANENGVGTRTYSDGQIIATKPEPHPASAEKAPNTQPMILEVLGFFKKKSDIIAPTHDRRMENKNRLVANTLIPPLDMRGGRQQEPHAQKLFQGDAL